VLGQINGHLIPLILDTGAANVPLLLEAESAAHAKIRPLRGVYLRGSGIGGSIRVGVGQFDSLQLAGQQILGPGHAGILLQTYSETVAGIRVRNLPLNLLGMKALKHFSYVAIDGPKKQVEFGVGHPYQPATGERFFQFKIRREGPSVDLKVGDQTMQVLLDTGCSSPLSLNASDFKNIPPDFIADTPTHAQKSMGVAGLETSRRGLLKEVAVGGIRIAPISFDSTATGTDPLLGWGAFRNRRIVLDFVEHRVWVTLQR
jgi:predicted aspartyl protease